MHKCWPALTVILGTMLSVPAHSDATLRFKVSTGKQSPAKIQTVFVKDGKFLVQAAGGDPNFDLLYTRNGDTLYVIDHQRRNFITFDEKAIAQISQTAAMVSAIQRQLAEHIKKMPPEQQERMKRMLGDIPDPEENENPGPRSIKHVGAGVVTGFSCKRLAVYRGDIKYSEMCVAEPSTVGLSADDMLTIRSLQAFQERVWTQASKISNKMGGHMPEFGGRNIPGVPVEMRDLTGPNPTVMTVMTANAGVGGRSMEIPRGYRATSLPTLGGSAPTTGPATAPTKQ